MEIYDIYISNKDSLKSTIEEIKAYSKTYENDKVTVIDLRKSHSRYLDQEPYYRLKEIQRILEEKIVGFFEDEEE
ncbi:hypothetical protein NPX93_22625 [Bacillus mycoides]|nr:hypothetical protein [Bacillus mycoides]MCQ6535706.1 hypothetical protein [Bacillus mycoides]QWI09942.1 hypothetical protein EXW47_05815 [Bacillus mycoides]QWI54355.1 hypothetical protein EXW42_09420 [Bacillus mycoides]